METRRLGQGVPGGRGKIRGADVEAPRGLYVVADRDAEPDVAREPAARHARPGGRIDRRSQQTGPAHGPLLFRRIRLDVCARADHGLETGEDGGAPDGGLWEVCGRADARVDRQISP